MAPAVQAFVSITLGSVVGKIVAAGLGSFASTVVAGGSLESAFQNGIIGVVSAGLAGSIGHGGIANKITNTFASSFGRGAATFIAHGVAQGSTSWLSGGKFRDGFIGAIVGHASGYAMAGLGLGAPGTGGLMATVTRTLVAASAGGMAASLTGGNFANGAISAAFVHLFNAEAYGAHLGVEAPSLGDLYSGTKMIGRRVAILMAASPTEMGDGSAMPIYDAMTGATNNYRARALEAAGISTAMAANYDVHHVVEYGAILAEPARRSLAAVGIGVHDLENLVVLPRSVHQRVHTNSYINAVNDATSAVVPAGYPGMVGTLNAIKGSLLTRGQYP